MKVKVCYACVQVTGTLDIRIDQNTPFFNEKFSGAPPQTRPSVGRGAPPPHTPLPRRLQRLDPLRLVPPNEMYGSATDDDDDDDELVIDFSTTLAIAVVFSSHVNCFVFIHIRLLTVYSWMHLPSLLEKCGISVGV